jgi:hypothetical protein
MLEVSATMSILTACVYCGKASGTTRDHVPPKNLLKQPFRPNLRTVPACVECNRGFSSNEEYFRRMLLTMFAHIEEADALFDGPVSRSFDRNPTLEHRMWNALGVERGRPFVELDTSAIRAVAQKIICGLTYLRSGVRLSRQTRFGIRIYEPEDRPTSIGSALGSASIDSEDEPNFTFRVADHPDHEHVALWELSFFNSLCIAVGVRA